MSQRALGLAKLQRVKPGSLKKSYLTLGLFPGTLAIQMPDGCPNVVAPVTRCLTDAEVYTILAWIQAGAQPWHGARPVGARGYSSFARQDPARIHFTYAPSAAMSSGARNRP